MKKARRIKAGVLAFTAVVSVAVTSVPVYAVEDSPVVYDLKAEQKNQENLEYDQAALDLLKYCNKDDFKTWDQSLAPMNDAQAQEIKTFVDDQIVKGETEDYKKARLIYDWITKNVRYAGSNDTDIGLAPYDVFTKKVAVCGGYSNLYKADTTWGVSNPNYYFAPDVKDFSGSHKTQDLVQVRLEGANNTQIGFSNGIAVVGVKDGITEVKIPEKFNDLDIVSVSSDIFNSTL